MQAGLKIPEGELIPEGGLIKQLTGLHGLRRNPPLQFQYFGLPVTCYLSPVTCHLSPVAASLGRINPQPPIRLLTKAGGLEVVVLD